MKHLIPPTGRRTRQALLLSALLAASAGAQAAGTAAGDTISNTATLTYSVGTVAQAPVDSNEASFVVDNKVDVLVTGGETVTTGVVPGATARETTFTVTNQGNATQDFALTVVSDISGDDFNPASCVISTVDGAASTHIDALDADASATVVVTCNIPTGLSNGDDGLVALVATAKAADNGTSLGSDLGATVEVKPSVTVAVVLADGAGSDDTAITGDADGLYDAAHSARNTYTVTTAVLSVAKAVTTVCDPINGTASPKNIPGAYVRYAITVTNESTSTGATLTAVTDTLAGSLAFDGELISGVGSCDTVANGGTSLSSTGFAVVKGTNSTTNYPVLDVDTQAVTAGATVNAGGDVTLTYGTLATSSGAVLTGGVLPPESSVTVYFNAMIK